jgi:hypothetical protein
MKKNGKIFYKPKQVLHPKHFVTKVILLEKVKSSKSQDMTLTFLI